MVAAAATAPDELSTRRHDLRERADNRAMTDTPPADLGRFLTVADAAEVLNVTPGEVLELVRTGELPAIPVGSARQWRIEREVLEGYIAAMYEQARRMSLWRQGDLADLLEFSAAPIIDSDPPRR